MTAETIEGEVRTLAERLLAHSVDHGDCRVWNAARNDSGYGVISVNDRIQRAHRMSYETFVGPIPDGLQLDHLCRNRACIRPAHLEAVSAAENTRRGASATKTHCKSGHEYTPENTYLRPRRASGGRRDCRVCRRDRYARLASAGGAA